MPPGKPATVDSSIAGFPPDVAFILERLRETILHAAPNASEAIRYGMPGFFLGKDHILYLGAWKKHIGIYPIYPQAPPLEEKLASLRASKDTVQLSYDKPIPYDLVGRLVKARVKELKPK